MSCWKFSLLILLVVNTALAGRFSTKECLEASYKTEIDHKGKFFGLIKNKLTIEKDSCKFNIIFKDLLETKWKVDICREPIHIKVHSKGGESFYKRHESCQDSQKSEFCNYWGDLKENLQDYGLIYAKGERESLITAHGQTYCAYLLLKKYLDQGILYSKYEEPTSIFNNRSTKKVKATKTYLSKPEPMGEVESPEPEATEFESFETKPLVDEADKPKF